MTTQKSNFDIVYEKMRKDPKFFEQLCENPEKAIADINIKLSEGEKAVVSLLKNGVVKGQTPQELQKRMSAKGQTPGRGKESCAGSQLC